MFRRKGICGFLSASELSSSCMAAVLKALEFLRILRDYCIKYIKRFPCRGASLLAFLGRKLIVWWRFCLGKLGPPKPTESPLGTQTSSYSVSGATVREYVIAASHVPPSASQPSLHELTERQPAAARVAQTVDVYPSVPASLSVYQPHSYNAPHPPGGRSLVNRSYANLSVISIQSRASDRYSIITNSPDALRAPRGQSSQLPRAIYRQFGRGPDPLPSREGAIRPSTSTSTTRPPASTTRPHMPTYPSRLEIVTTNLPSIHRDTKVDPVVQHEPSASSYTHEPLRIPKRQSSTSVVVDVQSPSTESLPISLTNQRQISNEPFVVDSSTAHSSPDSSAVDLPNEPDSPTSSGHPTLDFYLPEGRFLKLIHSEMIPRYTKAVTMQVGSTILSLHP